MSISLETDRLLLSAVTENDLNTLHDALIDPFVRKYLCDDEILSLEQTKEFVAVSQKNFESKQFGLWLMHTKLEKRFIGFVGLWYFFNEPQPQLLYALLPGSTKKGYATEGASRIISYCFDQLGYSYLIASCDEPNLESQRLAKRLGMALVDQREINGKPSLFFRIGKAA